MSEQIISLKTNQANKIRTLFEICDVVLSEGPLVFSSKGMQFTGSNYVVLADAYIFSESQDVDYVYTMEEEQTYLGVNFKIINDALSCVTPNDTVVFYADNKTLKDVRPYFEIRIINPNNYAFVTRVNLLLLETNVMECPSDNYKTVVSMSSPSFLKVLRFLQKKGEYVQIYTRKTTEVNDNNESVKYMNLFIRTCGDDTHAMFSERLQLVTNENEEECLKRDKYSIKCLHLIAKGSNLSSQVELYLRPKSILAVKYRIGTIGSVIFCLSPSVDEAEDCPLSNHTQTSKGVLASIVPKQTFKRPVRKRKKRVAMKECE